MRSDLDLSQPADGRLPAERTGFVGREAELAKIAALLENSRLVTLTGVGGVGKTRVAVRAAQRAQARYPDGVRLVELSALRDPALLADTIAAVLGLAEQDPRPRLDALLGYLRDRGMLLILDTCEHLVDECAILAEAILRQAPDVTLLVTSRQPLDVAGESTYRIPPMRLPGAAGAADDGDGAAIELFAQRAAAVVPGFAVTATNRADVIRLCRRLDGIPLAIELAAVRVRALPLRQLVSELDSGYELVTGGRRGAVDRHQTLHSAVAWSYDLCTPVEQALWARLSVFAGPFDFATAEEVCAGGQLARGQVAVAALRLVDKSVLLREPAQPPEADGTTRYRLLDAVREFGAQRLADDDSAGLVRGRYVACYLARARSFGDHFLDDDQLARYRKLRLEHANIRAALEYALAARHGPRERKRDGAELAAALYGYWQISGLLQEGRYWLAKAAEQVPADSRERAHALVVRAYLGALQGQPGEAITDASAGIEIADRLGAEPVAARGYLYLNLALTFAGQFAEAAAAGAEARRLLESLGDRIGLLTLDTQLGHLANSTGDIAAAMACVAQGLRRFGDSRELWLHGYLYTTQALALLAQPGRDAGCASAIGMALRAKYELGDIVGIALALEVHAWLAARAGRAARTAWLLGAAAPRWQAAGGRLAGAAVLEEFHRQAAEAARQALGGERYDELVRAGERHPLAEVVSLAVGDADELPGTGPSAASVPSGVLTNRERQIAALVASGLSNRQIAERMVISKRTVDAHVEHIFAKLGLKSRVQLTGWLRERAP
ncbi:MAG TPA: LuxR C-terminal-related transcriptional regulator [Trebonia sp.]|jgi:non-specific serine/threonine protein kinase|nr:LuxR C-terminal-related transcriptional regulator [Trebonia sp.]